MCVQLLPDAEERRGHGGAQQDLLLKTLSDIYELMKNSEILWELTFYYYKWLQISVLIFKGSMVFICNVSEVEVEGSSGFKPHPEKLHNLSDNHANS